MQLNYLNILPVTLVALLISSCSSLKDFTSNVKSSKEIKKEEQLKSFHLKWAKNLDPSQQTGNLPIALNSPLIYKGVLFAGDGEGVMRAFELENGRLVWQSKDNSYYHQKPIVYQDHIIYGTVEGRVYARHYLTGKVKFEVDLDTSVESAGVISNGRLYFHLRNHKLFALDAETGKILWAYRRSVPFLTTVQKVSRPLVVGNKLYVGFADGSVSCFAVEDGNLLWEQRLSRALKFVDVDATPVLYKDMLVVGSMAGQLSFMSPSTGNIIRTLPFSVARSPKVTNEGIYFVSIDGDLILYNHEIQEEKKVSLSQKSLGDFDIDKDRIYVGTLDGRLLELNRSDLKIKRTLELGHDQSAIFGDLSNEQDSLAFISSRYRLYVIKK